MPLSTLNKVSSGGRRGSSVPVLIIRDDPHADDALANGWDATYDIQRSKPKSFSSSPSGGTSTMPSSFSGTKTTAGGSSSSSFKTSAAAAERRREEQEAEAAAKARATATHLQRSKAHPMDLFKAEVVELLRRDAEHDCRLEEYRAGGGGGGGGGRTGGGGGGDDKAFCRTEDKTKEEDRRGAAAAAATTPAKNALPKESPGKTKAGDSAPSRPRGR